MDTMDPTLLYRKHSIFATCRACSPCPSWSKKAIAVFLFISLFHWCMHSLNVCVLVESIWSSFTDSQVLAFMLTGRSVSASSGLLSLSCRKAPRKAARCKSYVWSSFSTAVLSERIPCAANSSRWFDVSPCPTPPSAFEGDTRGKHFAVCHLPHKLT